MRRALSLAIILALAAFAAAPAIAADAPAAPATDRATTQLPRTVRPSHYDVSVVPDAAHLSFTGHVAIAIDVLAATRSITLQAMDMTFPKVALVPAGGGNALGDAKVAIDADAQTATFTFDRDVTPGSYRLQLDYTGKIGTQANGLFAIDYENKAGKQRALYTQFENSDARRFIPSWDEPSYKATFTLEANVPSAQMAISNMPVASSTDLGDGRKRIRFQTSPKMSTYLLFFGLGDFERATTRLGETEIGVVTQKGAGPQAAFALDSARDILREYNDYFGTPYPLPKLDNIASPGTSEFFGAMENWGAIYTFEHDMLLDPSISTVADRQGVFDVEAHEMAHQWFGDLVTMSWWDDLWLNEGFASWMQGRTTQKLHPEWNAALSAVGERERAMSRDAAATTHPVVQHIETVEQASQAFDAITYSKGESVIRMLEGYVGENAWREGVRRYMKAHAHGNTVSDDLWREIEAAAGKPILAIAHDFTLQPGVPRIAFERSACRNGSTTLTLSQGEFTKDRPGKPPLAWHVPVTAASVDGKAPVHALVENGHATLAVPGCGAIVANAGQGGYYRTLYSPAQFASLKAVFARLAPIDQLGIMGDVWSFGMTGEESASDYLDLVQVMPVDADPQIWSNMADTLDTLDGFYEGDHARQGALRAFAIARLTPVFARIGWEARPGESVPVTNLRADLIESLSALGDPKVIAEARRRYAAQDSDPSAMPPALRKTLLQVVARHADAATWDRLHAAALSEKSPMIRDDLYDLLSEAEDDALARRALELALTDEPGATNSAGMIGTVAGRHPEMAFDFAVAHREQVDAKVDSTSRAGYYPRLAGYSLDPASIGKLRAFADAHIAATSRRPTETTVATIQYRIMVRNERLPAIDAWLKKNGG